MQKLTIGETAFNQQTWIHFISEQLLSPYVVPVVYLTHIFVSKYFICRIDAWC